MTKCSFLATQRYLGTSLFFPSFHQYCCCNREHFFFFCLSFYHFRFSFLLINLSAFASTISGMQQHDTGMVLDISTASPRPALKTMTFVNFIYPLLSRAPRSSSTSSDTFCVRAEEDDSASTYTLLKPGGLSLQPRAGL